MAKKVYIAEFDADGKPYFRTLDKAVNETKKATGKIDDSFKKIAGSIAGYFSARELYTFAKDAVELGTKLKGVESGFNRLKGAESILMRLRKATQGTVTDLQLMQAAVKADNFKIPLNLLAKGLEFANKRAIQTGESVEYMVDSFITGVARKSIPILDNLGISQLELNKEIEKTGDFYTAIGNIVERENIKMKGAIDDTVTAQQRLNTAFENTKADLGKNALPYWSAFLGITNQLLSNFGNINTFLTGGGFMLAAKNTAMMSQMYGGSDANNPGLSNLSALGIGGKITPGMFVPAFKTGGGGGGGGRGRRITGGNTTLNAISSQMGASGILNNIQALGIDRFTRDMQEVAIPELQQSFDDIGLSFVQKFGETQNIAGNIANIFNVTADSFVGKMMQAFDVASSIFSILGSIGSLAGGGLFGFLGLAEGGTVINKHGRLSYAPIPKFARGGSYVVPPGYANDSGLIRVQSGERVDVTPTSQVPQLGKLLSEIKSSIQAGNMNSARKGKQPMNLSINIDGQKIAAAVFGYENNFNKRGVDKSQLRAGRGI